MLSQLCLPKSTSSVPSTSGGLRAPVTNALKHRENKYKTHQPARGCGVHRRRFPLDRLARKTSGRGITLGPVRLLAVINGFTY